METKGKATGNILGIVMNENSNFQKNMLNSCWQLPSSDLVCMSFIQFCNEDLYIQMYANVKVGQGNVKQFQFIIIKYRNYLAE